jgi:hypothetical protein
MEKGREGRLTGLLKHSCILTQLMKGGTGRTTTFAPWAHASFTRTRARRRFACLSAVVASCISARRRGRKAAGIKLVIGAAQIRLRRSIDEAASLAVAEIPSPSKNFSPSSSEEHSICHNSEAVVVLVQLQVIYSSLCRLEYIVRNYWRQSA